MRMHIFLITVKASVCLLSVEENKIPLAACSPGWRTGLCSMYRNFENLFHNIRV